MFDLDQAISEWRWQMAAGGIETPNLLAELESHLRDDVEQQLRAGQSAEKAFELAVQRLGHPKALRREFERIGEIPDAATWTHRITVMERDIMLPIKAVVTLMLLHFFYTSNWFIVVDSPEGLLVQFTQQAVWLYIALNLVVAVLLLASRRLPLAWLKRTIFTSSLTDGLFLSLLCLLTGGYQSVLYWVFLGLIVRNSVSIPRTASKTVLNLWAISCYALTGILDVWLIRYLSSKGRGVLELYADANATEQVLVRVMLLVLMAACCFLIESALSRQRPRPTTTRLA